LRIEATLTPQPAQGTEELPSSGPRPVQYPRAGTISFTLDGAPMSLAVYWIDVYGGGLFLPFRPCALSSYAFGFRASGLSALAPPVRSRLLV
jgi:hypothetical protein